MEPPVIDCGNQQTVGADLDQNALGVADRVLNKATPQTTRDDPT